jgi:tRNA(Ile)-lysidine synthase
VPGLDAAIEAAGRDALDRRLDPGGSAPLAVALSGGADSLLTLLTAKAWAERHGRRLLALTVDHQLQAESAAWTRRCGEIAAGLGAGFRALSWDGPKPSTGLPAAARTARHRLLAEAAREAGAKVLLLGHTASDVAEGEVMRAEGTNIGTLREWGPSPAWPEGRALFCLRPLLGLTRDEVRTALAAAGRAWIDDPANEDVRYGRTRARTSLKTPHHPRESGDPGVFGAGRIGGRPADEHRAQSSRKNLGPRFRGDDGIMRGARAVTFERAGFAHLTLDLAADPAFLQILLLCISGGEIPARGSKVEALAHNVPQAATLGGCKLARGDGQILVTRELGRVTPPPLHLTRNEPAVWDGRFEITTDLAGLTIVPLKGLAARLPPAEHRALAAVPAAARPSLPAIVHPGDQTVTCPFLAEAPRVRVRALAAERFAAACGLIAHEAAI